jgi:uncharacterized membrane protein
MNSSSEKAPASLRLAAVAILTALTAVVGFVRVPLPATQGIFTLADIVIYFAAFALGPWSAAVAGGLGTALIDLLGGTAQYAPTSLVVHGLQGLLAGLVAGIAGTGTRPGLRGASWVLAGAVGTVVMAGGYLAAETLFYGGFAKAVTEILFNIAQSVVGAVGGGLLAMAVRKGYPPVQRLRW